MAMVSAVTMLFVLLFCVILLFHSVQQNRYNTASQLESIARSVRGPLSASILKGDIPEAETILKRIQPAGCEPGGCGATQSVSGAADELYPGASRPDDGHAPV
jgi:hypothetical protein